MKSKLFEMVLHESTYDGMEQVTNEKELKTLLDMGCNVYAHGTGPFGEDEDAKVIGFGKIKDLRNKLKGIEWTMDEEGYDANADVEEWFADNGETTAVVLDKSIGQEPCNFYTLDAYTVEDLDLWAHNSEVERYFKGEKNTSKDVKTCPNCGGEDFYYVKLDKLVMGREKFDACTKCGAMYPILSYERRNNKE